MLKWIKNLFGANTPVTTEFLLQNNACCAKLNDILTQHGASLEGIQITFKADGYTYFDSEGYQKNELVGEMVIWMLRVALDKVELK